MLRSTGRAPAMRAGRGRTTYPLPAQAGGSRAPAPACPAPGAAVARSSREYSFRMPPQTRTGRSAIDQEARAAGAGEALAARATFSRTFDALRDGSRCLYYFIREGD